MVRNLEGIVNSNVIRSGIIPFINRITVMAIRSADTDTVRAPAGFVNSADKDRYLIVGCKVIVQSAGLIYAERLSHKVTGSSLNCSSFAVGSASPGITIGKSLENLKLIGQVASGIPADGFMNQ